MRRRPFHRVRLLRRLLLGLLALTIAGVAGLFWLGRVTRPPTNPGAGGDADMGGEEITYEATGFDHTVTIGDRPLFRVRAERTASGAEGREPRLQEVDLTYFREDGSEYGITAESGSYDVETQAAELDGDVVVRGADGFTLRTERLTLAPRSEWLASARGVTFQINERLSGAARQLRADLDKNVFRLDGPVVITGTTEKGERLALNAKRVNYERDRGFIRAQGKPVLQHGASRLSARRVSVKLDEVDGDVRFLSARWGVTGHIRSEEAHRVEVNAHLLNGEFHPDSRELHRLELTGSPKRPALVNETQGTAFSRRLTGQRVEATFATSGALEQVVSSGAAELVEKRREGRELVTRSSRAESMTAQFAPDGSVAAAALNGHVAFHDGPQQVTGDKAVLPAGSGTVTVTGTPARAREGGRELSGPVLRYEPGTGMVRGDEGVHAMFEPDENVELPAADRPAARPPVQIDAESLEVDTRKRGFVFTGRVQAWQGESYLLTDRLTGSEAGQLLTADGQVKTVWEKAPGAPGEDPGPATEITGSRLLYARAVRHLTYFGPATVRQGPRRMECGRVEAQLDEREQARRMLCIGDVMIDDGESGRRVTGGNQATYDTATDEIVVTGRPVTLREANGSEVQGERVEYRLDDGTATVLSPAAEASRAADVPAVARKETGGEEGRDDG
ncbi:MAG: LPS export ABC transporter periplasmic protein LptC [Thermoanaerobaculia bacterium]